MKLTTFWIVTKPTPRSTLADICFETDTKGLCLQFLGGLNPEHIHGMYTEKSEAFENARALLENRKKP